MPNKKVRLFFIIFFILILSVEVVFGLEPPTRAQIQKYKKDGTYTSRVLAAKAIGNHRVAPELVARMQYKINRMLLQKKGLSI